MTAAETVVEPVAPVAPDRVVRPLLLPRHLLVLARPGHVVKNLLAVPLALVDTPVWTASSLWRCLWAIGAFTLASSVIYVLNDIADRHLDRAHPDKQHRPIAAGHVPVPVAWAYAVLLAVGLVAVTVTGPEMTWWPLIAYLALSAAYSRWLKHLPLLDVCVVSTGFVLRVLQGYAATETVPASLLLTAVFSGCLVLILGKRRHELSALGTPHRPALHGYNLLLADHLLGLTTSLAGTTFLLYLHLDAPIAAYPPAVLALVVPLGLLAAFRYLQAVLVLRTGGDPIRILLRDRTIVGCAVLIGVVLAVAQINARYPHLLTWMD
ncbi:UbiA prenyltransferase family protein [Verrucosispora sp. NA02020]|uniref:UbiA prenyltransferase family protein n=1 Tax=Verrucosispora sp. NA02020 TaxID=2742132 RepID=UPI00158FFC7C|nr:UbiA prenyltransferase family protein [Verrucosispora sp. NA02020]QKW14420.1 UbiA prenyltransferase family protein [Verrucosispora sp. NA02020]